MSKLSETAKKYELLVPWRTSWPQGYDEFFVRSARSNILTVVVPTRRDNKITAELLRALADDLECGGRAGECRDAWRRGGFGS